MSYIVLITLYTKQQYANFIKWSIKIMIELYFTPLGVLNSKKIYNKVK